MADEALQAAADVEKLSFYGLHHWLGVLTELLDRVDQAALVKKPSDEDAELIEQKDDLVSAQSSIRRAMGSRLESPELTKRERPLAEEFLQQQIGKLERGAAASSGEAEKKAAKALEKLRTILDEVKKKKVVAETKEIQEIEASIAAANADWKEVSPIYEKWEKGRHSFKNNDELQAMKRRFTEAKKVRENGAARLAKALCSTREGKQLAKPQETIPKGWSSTTKKAPAASARLGAARAKPRAPQPNSWGSAVVSFAQRLRAEQVAQVRQEAEGEEENDDDEEEDDTQVQASTPSQAAKPAAPKPKAAPPLPQDDGFSSVKAGSGFRQPRPAPPPPPVEESEEDEEQTEVVKQNRPQNSHASAKKKGGKAGKKKRGGGGRNDDDDEDVPEPPAGSKPSKSKPSGAAWMAAAEAAISGSVLEELLKPASWSMPSDEAAVEERLDRHKERLPWLNPLGLCLPLDWKEFAGLEIDGGPKATSKRGTTPGIDRVQENFAALFAHYVSMVFLFIFLHELSQFGLLLLVLIVQAGLILAPAEIPVRGAQRVLLLQASHLILWLLFVRAIWQMHFFVKCFTAICIASHAYVAVPLKDE